eukprot:TRINITY_DN46236_c0_g1_i1.p1 TRINITY_DN46236_c0_g1~~TRINITY_DN46236_c0_g1_i1.p1  ORF type:complete len:245 (+),score=4.43 TRINITY_DN46236_c0_g1_i1:78-812(+)
MILQRQTNNILRVLASRTTFARGCASLSQHGTTASLKSEPLQRETVAQKTTPGISSNQLITHWNRARTHLPTTLPVPPAKVDLIATLTALPHGEIRPGCRFMYTPLVTCTKWLKALADARCWTQVAELRTYMHAHQIYGDKTFYSTLLCRYCDGEKLDDARQALDEMRTVGVAADYSDGGGVSRMIGLFSKFNCLQDMEDLFVEFCENDAAGQEVYCALLSAFSRDPNTLTKLQEVNGRGFSMI